MGRHKVMEEHQINFLLNKTLINHILINTTKETKEILSKIIMILTINITNSILKDPMVQVHKIKRILLVHTDPISHLNNKTISKTSTISMISTIEELTTTKAHQERHRNHNSNSHLRGLTFQIRIKTISHHTRETSNNNRDLAASHQINTMIQTTDSPCIIHNSSHPYNRLIEILLGKVNLKTQMHNKEATVKAELPKGHKMTSDLMRSSTGR